MKELSEWIDWARGSAGRLQSYGALLELLTELRAARLVVAELYPMEWSAYRGLLRVANELRAAREELAELAAGRYIVVAIWGDGELAPDECQLHDGDGPANITVDATGLVAEVIRRQEELHRRELSERRNQLQLLNAELDTAREELATAQRRLIFSERELRELRDALEEPESYQLGGVWSDDGPVPADYVLLDDDGNPVEVDALEVRGDLLVGTVLARQAKAWVRAAEMTPSAVPLEQLLAMVPAGWDLVVDSETGRRPQYHAGWFRGGAATGRKLEEHHGEGADCARAIRAATIALLRGRQRCGTCAHWGSPGDEDGDRECRASKLRLRKTAESSCGESWEPARWLEPELPVSPARLVRAALAWADEIGRLGNLHYTAVEQELFAAANELRGTEPGDGEGRL